ncbi:MAG: hypothetical protein NC320_08980 [Clostridium sp.]|nr:hypothetical protein [Clostridium sp.]MCM1547940.1 hypothetical protein [Ruminococcus sp.]
MKKSEIYKSIIKDVISASGGDITDEYFDKIKTLFSEYETLTMLEKNQEEING